jgi:hypothetical protein
MKKQKKPNGYWTLERCQEESLLYKTKTKFRYGNASAYSIILKNGWMDEIFNKEESTNFDTIRNNIIDLVKIHSVKYYYGQLTLHFPSDLNNDNTYITLTLHNPRTIQKYIKKHLGYNTSNIKDSSLEALEMTLKEDLHCGVSLEVGVNIKVEDILQLETN